MKLVTVFAAALLLVSGSVLAQQKGPGAANNTLNKIDPLGPEAQAAQQQWMDKPLPEMKGVVSWKMLGEVKPVKQKDKFVPEFAKAVSALDKKEVKIQGFMMPLDMGERQQRFILTALPPSCSFCLPGGPEQMVEVQAKTAVKYGFEPIMLTGKLSVLKDDPMGLYYRLTDAVITTGR